METEIGMDFNKRRFSYFDKLIADEDIPLEELNYLEPSDHKHAEMNIYSQPPVAGHFDMRSAGSEFETEAYLEYRRRVFEQLAEDYEKDQQNATEEIKPIYEDETQTQLHSTHQQTTAKIQTDLQASWDDSDLKSETYFLSSQASTDNQTPFWQLDQETKSQLDKDNHLTDNHGMATDELDSTNSQALLSNWSSFEDQIAKAQKGKSNSSESISNQSEKSDQHVFSGRTRRLSKNSFQKQKLDRELIRKKLSMPDPDEEDTNYGSDKPWQQPRYERSYSTCNQSLQICYINESCSSDENENNLTGEKSQTSETKSSSASPTASPYFASPRGYGKGYMRQHRLSDASSPTSSLSSLSTTTNSDGTIVHHSHHDLRSGRSKHEEMELEARYQLAQAHQKAKEQAMEDRQRNKLTKNSSIVHKLLSVSLNDETNAKIKAYALTKYDCRQMTLGQLQLILNDMHTKKQALNEGLVTLLVERDDLQTQQDSKLVDIEDMKAILNSLGPETTV